MQVLFTDDIPGPRDIVIICLADACGLFDRIMSEAEVERARKRTDLVRRMDLIGQAVSKAVRDIETSLAATVFSPFQPPRRVPRGAVARAIEPCPARESLANAGVAPRDRIRDR